MNRIAESDLVRLGFEIVHMDDSSEDYYYFRCFGQPYGLRLTSCTFNEWQREHAWFVEFTDMGSMEFIEDLELLEEFIHIMERIQNIDRVTYRNRYDDLINFEFIDDSIIMTLPAEATDFVRVGYYDNQSLQDSPNTFSMVDPSGGPFIATKEFNGGSSGTDMGEFHKSWSGLIVAGIEWIGMGKYKLIVDRNED